MHASTSVPQAAIIGENRGVGPGIVGRTNSDNSAVRGDATIGVGIIGVHRSSDAERPAILALNSGAGAGVSAIAPGNHPAVLARSGSQAPTGGPAALDCGLALLAIGKSVLRLPAASDGLAAGTACVGPALRVEAPTAAGVALDIAGKARFATAGVATVPADADSVSVTAPVDPATSLVLVTLLSDPGSRVPWVSLASGVLHAQPATHHGSAKPCSDRLRLVRHGASGLRRTGPALALFPRRR